MSTNQATPNPPEPPHQVGLGTQVEVELIDQQGNRESMTFDLVREQMADMERGLLGENTPLARAIRGKAVGSTVPYNMGDIRRVHIVSVRLSALEDPIDAEARRQAILKKAIDDAERTNAEMFASSFTGKWGDYKLD